MNDNDLVPIDGAQLARLETDLLAILRARGPMRLVHLADAILRRPGNTLPLIDVVDALRGLANTKRAEVRSINGEPYWLALPAVPS